MNAKTVPSWRASALLVLKYRRTSSGEAMVSTAVATTNRAMAAVMSRLTKSSPASGRVRARMICGTRTALRVPPASSR
nr:hypothetical protein [Phycicoccus sp. HDW14]